MCEFMRWNIYSGKQKILQFEELGRICKYHKEGNKIIIDEVFAVAVEPVDGRSKNNIFINPIEAILLFTLKSIDNDKYNLYFSNKKFYQILGLFNKEYSTLESGESSDIIEALQVDYLSLKSFKVNSKSEANKIIKRALESQRKRKVIDYFEGRIIVGVDDKQILATIEETKVITRLEKESCNKLGCITYGQLEFRNLFGKYYYILNDKLEKSEIEDYKYSYRGYCVTSHNKSVAEEIDRNCKDENFKKLNDLFIDKMKRVVVSRNKSAIKKQTDKMTFGEPILNGEAQESFLNDTNKLINTYIKK